MRYIALSLFIFVITVPAFSKTIEVGAGKLYLTLQSACIQALPGDTILIYAGTYNNGDFIANLKGNANAWITIKAAPAELVVFKGGSQAFQMSDPEYVHIKDLVFEMQTANGVNIDDAGSFDTPAKYLIIENCHWKSMSATGNNDELKLSGVDNFIVRNCTFSNGSPGGSLIDMVGCHQGLFENNVFTNGGSNCIQAKGGSKDITIFRNKFVNGGQRAINVGGSTGLQFFRPPGANTEASSIFVHSNIFIGSFAPLAFVGAVNCEAINNTIIEPDSWAVRILQENTEPGMLPCGNNTIKNNIFVFGNTGKPAFNIGGNTSPQSFICSNNLWFNPDNTSWSGPNTPVSEPGIILNQDPLFIDTSFHISKDSPAASKGENVILPVLDFFGFDFKASRSIGAVETEKSTSAFTPVIKRDLIIYPNPASDFINILFLNEINQFTATITDVQGKIVSKIDSKNVDKIYVGNLSTGLYSLSVNGVSSSFFKK